MSILTLLGIAGATLIIVAFVARYGLYRIPPMQYGIVNTFGRRGRVVGEGLTLLIPFAQKVDIFSTELQLVDIPVKAKSNDMSGIIINGLVQYALDPKLISIYEETSRNIAKALIAAVENEIGAVAGTKKLEDFVKEREAMVLLINCLLRLKDLPHENPKTVDEQSDGKATPVPQRLAFYRKHANRIKQFLAEESQKTEERSKIETAYGIDIRVFDVKDISFTPETEKILEKTRQAKALSKAAEILRTSNKQFQELGLNAQQSEDAAEIALGLTTDNRKFSLQGSLINLALGRGGS